MIQGLEVDILTTWPPLAFLFNISYYQNNHNIWQLSKCTKEQLYIPQNHLSLIFYHQYKHMFDLC